MTKKHFKLILAPMLMLAASFAFVSCDDDDDCCPLRDHYTALVTIYPQDDDTFTMQLNETTTLVPSNIKKSPYGDKEVRALVGYIDREEKGATVRNVTVNWMDSIRTKYPVMTTGDDVAAFGNDPIEIVKDWVTIAEDGYLTLRLRTLWGQLREPHYVNLVYGTDENDPYLFELRHDAKGDTQGVWGDALIAFNLNKLFPDKDNVTIKVKWNSFSGQKTTEFPLTMHGAPVSGDTERMWLNERVK